MKKFISMALALVMTLSLCTFVAVPEADAFTDTGELSQYAKQAIDVIQTIDVMAGYEDDTFKPEATLTRQAAAKIICNMILGPIAAKALPTNEAPFPDVNPGTEWAGYISYCSHEKIINGYSDNTFKPTGALTGYAFLKMLLGALGYSGSAEGFTGGNWKVNVAKIALGIGLNKGITSDPDGENLDKGVTREDAAIYAFNTLQGDMVEYPSQNSININGVTVSMGSGKATPQTWTTSTTSANNINDRRDNGNAGAGGYPIVQFAERYFDKLVRDPAQWDTYTQDDFGRPSIKWSWKGVSIGTYSRDPDAVFVGNVKVNAIYEALKMTSGDDEAHLYINSKRANNEALDVSRGNDKDLDHSSNLLMWHDDDTDRTTETVGTSRSVYGDGNHRVDRIGNGTLIECFRNTADNHVDVCVISVYGGKIDAVKEATAKKDRYVTVVYADDVNHRPGSITGNGRNEFETEDFEEEDYVAYTYSDSDMSIKNMYLLSSDSGSLTSRVKEKNMTLDDTRFDYGKEYAFYEMTENDLSSKSSYVVYTFRWGDVDKYADLVDDDEYALWIEEDEFAVDQYVLIERITIENKSGKNASSTLDGNAPTNVQAVVRTSTGARRTYALDDSKNYRTDITADENRLDERAIATGFRKGRIVRLSSNSNGYRLHKLDDKYMFSVTDFYIEGKTIYCNNGKKVTTNEGKTLIVDSETHFTVEDVQNETYKEYLGTKNVPDVTGPTKGYNTGATAYIYNRGALAKQIFITNANNVSSSTKDVIFLVAPSTSNLVESDDGNYYDVTAVDKDVVKTLRIKDGTLFGETGSYFYPGSDIKNTKDEGNCVILNKITYDSNDLVIGGTFDDTKVDWNRAIGIRRMNSGEVRLDTYYTSSYLLDVAENVRVFFCDGSDVEQIDYEDIVNDTKDAVYYVLDDSVVTYIFIVNYEGDGIPTAAKKPAASEDSTTYPLDQTAANAAGYKIDTLGVTEVEAGKQYFFTVKKDGNAVTRLDATVTLKYTSTADDPNGVVEATTETDEDEIWSVTIPTDVNEGSSFTFEVAAKTE